MSDAVVSDVSKVAGVESAIGSVNQFGAIVLNAEDESVGGSNSTPLGVSWEPEQESGQATVLEGQAPTGDGQLALDSSAAERANAVVGDRVRVSTPLDSDAQKEWTVTAVVDIGLSGGVTVVLFDLPTAQKYLVGEGRINQVLVTVSKGSNPTDVASAINESFASDKYEAITGREAADQQEDQITSSLSFLSTFLLIFALVAVFVSTFLIFNTFSMVVAQRTREIALLRAIGASRDQIQRSVVLEALIVALVASTVGLALGIGLALGLRFLFARFGIELPSGAFEVAPRTIVAAYTVGIVVTIAAAWIPAIRASSVPPLAALRAETAPARASLVRRLWFGLAGLVFAVLFAFLGLSNGSETGVAWIGVSAVFGIGGTIALTPFLAGPALSLLGLPFRGAVGRLAVQNSRRSPRRTAATASALMIGQGRAAVDGDLADSKGWNVGDTVEVTWRTGQSEVEIVATFQKVLVFEGFLTDYETVQRWGAPPGQDTAVYLKLAEGADPDAVRSSVEEVLVKYPTVSVLDQAQIKADIQAQIDQLLRFVFALLGLAIIIAVLGIVNTLLLSVAERTGELGLLRAIGATPQVLRRDWRHHLHLDVGSTRSIRHPSHPNHCARSHLRPRRDLRQDLLFANRGQLRRRNTDDQDLQGECLTLLTNAVVCWNTVYIAAAIDHLRQTGLVITEEQIRHLSPAGREHINRYDFYTPSLPDHGQLRPLRTCSVGSCPFTAGTPLGVVVFHATSGIPACDRHRSPMSFSTMRRTVLTPNSRISALSAL